ncbi:MAG TPA: sugar kinase [Roseiarcus sp.]|jgi:2-dehydro-3-deoxygluconokinase
MTRWREGSLIGIGEAMVELAPVAEGLYAQGFAGDTLNTCWYLKRLVGDLRRVRYLTRVGEDALSGRLVDLLVKSGIDATAVSRDPERTLGLYLISLEGAERRFSYWRDQSAARRLADDPASLDEALRDAALIHVSGITLAIVEAKGRQNLLAALAKARGRGARVSFDPNVRRRLWLDEATLRAALTETFSICDIALPSFDDEAAAWGDADPATSVARIAALGVGEIVVKNGAGPAFIFADGVESLAPARAVSDARDTTGAGDSFNAGYLAARIVGISATRACEFAHELAAEVVRHPGALAPPAAIEPLRDELLRHGAP